MWRVRISPCPNDTFIFYHLINTYSDEFKFEFEDIQTLNERCLQSDGDIIKVSFAMYPRVQNEYIILESGSALGKGCGPLIVGKKKLSLEELESLPVALPGKFTTANRLFELFYPNAKNKIFTTYDNIMTLVENGSVASGVIIHESRFTYKQHGLELVSDLGKMWEDRNHIPLPLGGIIAKRSIDASALQNIASKIRTSVEWAMKNRNDQKMRQFIKSLAREIDDSVIDRHIDLYVNQYSVSLLKDGKEAIACLLNSQINSNLTIFAS